MKRLVAVLTLSLALGFLGLYLVAGGALFRAETYRIQDASVPILAFCVVALLAEWTAPAIRIGLLCRKQGIPMPFRPALFAHLVAVVGAALTPSNSGGAPTTVAALSRLGVPLGKGIGVVVQIFVLDLVFYAWVVPLSLGYLIYSDTIKLPASAEILAFTAVSLAIAGAVVLTRYPRLVARFVLTVAKLPLLKRFDKGLHKIARDYYRSANAFLSMPVSLWLALHLVTAVGWLAAFALLWGALTLYGVDANLLATLALSSSISLLSHFIPTPGGSGFIEAAMGLSVGADSNGSVAVAVLVWRLASFYVIFLLGPLAGWLLYLSPPVVGPPKVAAKAPKREPEKHL